MISIVSTKALSFYYWCPCWERYWYISQYSWQNININTPSLQWSLKCGSHTNVKNLQCVPNGDRISYTNFVVQSYIGVLKTINFTRNVIIKNVLQHLFFALQSLKIKMVMQTEHFLLQLLHIKSIQITKCRDVVFLGEAVTGNLVYLRGWH